jgi:hypothetical protein
MKNSLEILGETSPRLAFRNFRETAARIKTLEAQLGIAPGKPLFNVRRASARISELETMLASKTAAVAPAVAPSAAAPADYQPDPNLSADEQIKRIKAAGGVTTPAGARLRSQRAAIVANLPKLTGTSRECANHILKKS